MRIGDLEETKLWIKLKCDLGFVQSFYGGDDELVNMMQIMIGRYVRTKVQCVSSE